MADECSGCKSGLEKVARTLMSGDDAKIAQLSLCVSCKQKLIQTVEEVFEKDVEEISKETTNAN